MLEQGFSRYALKQVVSKGDVLGRVEVLECGHVDLLAGGDFVYSLAADESLTIGLSGPGFVYAPVVEGADAGFANILLEGRTVGRSPLVYGETIEQVQPKEKSFLEKLFGGN